MSRAHDFLFVRGRILTCLTATALYASIVLLFGERLAISNNYFVALPVLAAALCFSVPGGLVAGLLGLPANLLLFALLGHPEYSPASKPIAEGFGLILGFSLGYVAHNFRKYESEIRRRMETEKELTAALQEKDLLLKELSHRVKNNLSVIKSIAQLQRNRSADPDFRQAVERLVQRIHAIALVHDQLYTLGEGAVSVDPERYVGGLVANLLSSYSDTGVEIVHSVRVSGALLDPEEATCLGLIINESLTNSIKYAVGGCEDPAIFISMDIVDGEYRLVIRDNGPGFGTPPTDSQGGLGQRMIQALARQLDGRVTFENAESRGCVEGARVELRWPRERKQV
ncbi:MAG TPA: sensor histidine kinase [Rectinemataceae bacterium]|nr:sensor histidine kinase [Rectinemataceae bacterium]